MTFRTRVFITSLLTAAITLAVAVALVSYAVRRSLTERIERSLVDEARLAAETLSHRRAATPAELDAEADALGRLVSARVTFIGPDGSVVGDSGVAADALRTVENHSDRPEVQQARREGVGIARRYSTTVGVDMLYVAVRVANSGTPALSEVRLALPLTDVSHQLASVRRMALVAGGAGLLAALVLAWAASTFLTARVWAIATMAQRYAAGDLSATARDFGADELGIVARALDTTAREMGRQARDLAADRARMEAMLAGMTEGVLILNERGRLQLVNAAARRMLRVSEAPEGRHYLEVVRHPAITAQVALALRGKPADGVELPLQPGLTIVSRTAPIAAPAPTGAVVVLHDITDLRRTDRIRRDFVANVSHELRTPLTAVRGAVEALHEEIRDHRGAGRFLDVIARHAYRMERLVRDLLRLARLDAGQEAREHEICDVEELFSGVEAELEDALSARDLRLERCLGPGAATLRGDPPKLHDALRNLLENAINYSPDQGTIVMAAERRDDRILLTVADSGCGIPEEDLSRVFERFYRVDKARSRGARDPGGTGLGLAIVKHLVELHGGRVSAANRPEGGAIFTLDLPA